MRILLTGASGQLGAYLLEELVRSGHRVVAWSRRPISGRPGVTVQSVDITNEDVLRSSLNISDPEVIIHAAAMSAAEEVRKDLSRGMAVNVESSRRLATWCRDHARRLVFTSTDLVFDGMRSWYREVDEPRPVQAYGRTKALAELEVLEVPGAIVARLSLLYGPSRAGRDTHFDRVISGLRAGLPQLLFEDEFRTPLHYRTAAQILVRLAESGAQGIVHIGGRERVSRFELMRKAAQALDLDSSLVQPNRQADRSLAEPRPADVSLDTSRLQSLLPDFDRPSLDRSFVIE